MKNWIEGRNGMLYRHRANLKMVVKIMRSHDPVNAAYFVYHTHPGFHGIVIPQKMERATTMKHARQLAAVHLRHWDNASKWRTDPDFGKAN